MAERSPKYRQEIQQVGPPYPSPAYSLVVFLSVIGSEVLLASMLY